MMLLYVHGLTVDIDYAVNYAYISIPSSGIGLPTYVECNMYII